MKDAPNPARPTRDPQLLLPGEGALHAERSPGHASWKQCDPVWVWPRCWGKSSAGPGRPSAARDPEARAPLPPQRVPSPGLSVLPGPRKLDTHFRRVHDLPRLLLRLAAGVGAGHRDNGTGRRSPPSLTGVRRVGPRVCSLPHSLRPPGTPVTAHALRLRVEGRLRKDRETAALSRSRGAARRAAARHGLLF